VRDTNLCSNEGRTPQQDVEESDNCNKWRVLGRRLDAAFPLLLYLIPVRIALYSVHQSYSTTCASPVFLRYELVLQNIQECLPP
jgi:hypothetical protein